MFFSQSKSNQGDFVVADLEPIKAVKDIIFSRLIEECGHLSTIIFVKVTLKSEEFDSNHLRCIFLLENQKSQDGCFYSVNIGIEYVAEKSVLCSLAAGGL